MKIRIISLLIVSILAIQNTYGQYIEPMDLAKKIFGKEVFILNIDNYIIDEYQGQPNGHDLRDGAILNFTLLGQTDKKAVVSMTVSDSTGKGFDAYLHFRKDSIWKMSAFRTLAMTGILAASKIELESMTPQQVDDMIKRSKFSDRSEFDFQLGNIRLTLESDDNITKHFLANKMEFERIKDIALQELERNVSNEDSIMEVNKKLKTDYKKLFISSISFDNYHGVKHLNFLIGGVLDNSVGYIYVKDIKDLPEMSSDDIIMLKEIGNGWYIYKTT